MAHIMENACSRKEDTRSSLSSARNIASRSKSLIRRSIWRLSLLLRFFNESASVRYSRFWSASVSCISLPKSRIFWIERFPDGELLSNFRLFFGFSHCQKLFFSEFFPSSFCSKTVRCSDMDCSNMGNRSESRLSIRLAVEGASAKESTCIFFSASKCFIVSIRDCCRESG